MTTESETIALPPDFAPGGKPQAGYHLVLGDVRVGGGRPARGVWELKRNPPSEPHRAKTPSRAEYLWIAAVWLAAEGCTRRQKYLLERTKHFSRDRGTIYRYKDTALQIVQGTMGLAMRLEPAIEFIRSEWPIREGVKSDVA